MHLSFETARLYMHKEQDDSALMAKCMVIGSLMASWVLDTWWPVPIAIIAVLVGRYTAHNLSKK